MAITPETRRQIRAQLQKWRSVGPALSLRDHFREKKESMPWLPEIGEDEERQIAYLESLYEEMRWGIAVVWAPEGDDLISKALKDLQPAGSGRSLTATKEHVREVAKKAVELLEEGIADGTYSNLENTAASGSGELVYQHSNGRLILTQKSKDLGGSFEVSSGDTKFTGVLKIQRVDAEGNLVEASDVITFTEEKVVGVILASDDAGRCRISNIDQLMEQTQEIAAGIGIQVTSSHPLAIAHSATKEKDRRKETRHRAELEKLHMAAAEAETRSSGTKAEHNRVADDLRAKLERIESDNRALADQLATSSKAHEAHVASLHKIQEKHIAHHEAQKRETIAESQADAYDAIVKQMAAERKLLDELVDARQGLTDKDLKLEKAKAKSLSSEDKLKELSTRIETLASQNRSEVGKLRSLEEELFQKKAKVATLETALKAAQQTRLSHADADSAQIEKLRSVQRQVEEEKARVEKELALSRAEVETSQREIAVLSATIASTARTDEERKARTSILGAESAMRAEIAGKAKDALIARLKHELTEIRKAGDKHTPPQTQEIEVQTDLSGSDLDAILAENAALSASFQKISGEMAALKSRTESFDARPVIDHATLQKKLAEVKDLQEKNAAISDTNATLAARVEEQRRALDEKIKQQRALSTELRETKETLKAQEKDLRKKSMECEVNLEKITRLQALLAHAREGRGAAEKELADRSEEFTGREKELADRRLELIKSSETIVTERQKLEEERQRLEDSERDAASLYPQLIAAQTRNEELDILLFKKRSENYRLQTTLEAQKSELEQTRLELQDQKSELEQTKTDLESQKDMLMKAAEYGAALSSTLAAAPGKDVPRRSRSVPPRGHKSR